MLKCNLNKVALQSNFIEITLQHGCKLAAYFQDTFPLKHLWVAASELGKKKFAPYFYLKNIFRTFITSSQYLNVIFFLYFIAGN